MFGIALKKETTMWNLSAFFLGPMIAIAVGSYINAMMPILL